MENRRIMILVEDVDSARSALKWKVQNLLRYGDFITLLHVYPSSRSKNKQKQRVRRLKGFQLASSFKDLYQGIPEAKVEIIVTEGDEGATIISLVEKIGASSLVGIHDHSFIYRYVSVDLQDVIPRRLNWRPPSFYGREDLETIMASNSAADWIRIY